MKKIIIVIALTLVSQVLIAEDGITASSELLLQAVLTHPEAKLGFIQRFHIPFLQGGGPLTKDNNINLVLTAEATPISVNLIGEAIWTPIAFIELIAGGRIGSGWTINLFDSDIYGIGLNNPGIDGKAEFNGTAFDGLLWKCYLGGAFQFDLAAIFPGDWNHVLFRTYHEINYNGYTRARSGQSWYFENDYGENRNGFNYYGNFLIGYQMPIFLNIVGILTEMDLYLYDTPNRSDWGDDLIRWTFGCILSFEITEKFGIALITQFRTRRNYTNFDERKDDKHSVFYQNRKLDTSKPQRLEFYRIAAMITYKL